MPKPLTVWITTNWKIFQEMGLPDNLTCLLRNLYVSQETTELNMEHQNGSKSGKDYIKAVYCHPAYLLYMQSTSWETLGWKKFMVHVLLRPGLENLEHYFTSMWDEYNCAVVWAFFGIAFLWDWNENWPFPVLWPLLSFENLLASWVQHLHSIIFQNLK